MVATASIQVPGKLFLTGEYAITRAGQWAVIAAVQQGLQFNFRPIAGRSTASVHVDSPALAASQSWQWTAQTFADLTSLQAGPWAYVKMAAALFYQEHADQLALADQPDLQITIASQLQKGQAKLGLGSSAAVTVGMVKTLHQYYQLTTDPLRIFKEAAFAHYLVQGSGSLGDLAAASFGGLIAYRSPAWLQQAKQGPWQLTDFAQLDWSQLNIQSLPWPGQWQLGVVPSFEPASTKKALAKQLSFPKPFYEQANEASLNLADACQRGHYDQAIRALADNQAALLAQLPAAYLTPALSRFLAVCRELRLAGKVSGAGFGDNGVVILPDQQAQIKLQQQLAAVGLSIFYPVLAEKENRLHGESPITT
ncbi:hypothetical protein PT274_02300 [Leuconostocaceae bacterium ESL0958]|nr:hypothetical protein [Leuconostocaceae bacterium ESL0958]